MENESIIQTTRAFLGLGLESEEFKFEVISHINTAFAILNQNGAGRKNLTVTPEMKWEDFIDPAQVHGNKYWGMIPMYVHAKTKLIFDPPPPSIVTGKLFL